MKKLLNILLLFVGILSAKSVESESIVANNYLSLGIGTATKDLNLLQINYNRRLYKKLSLYGYLGIPTIMGLGLSWKQSNNNGLAISSGFGWNPFITGISGIGGDMYYLNIMHQWKLYNMNTYLSIGMQINVAQKAQTYIYKFNNEKTTWGFMPYPIISIDWRLNTEKNKSKKIQFDKYIIVFILTMILISSIDLG